MIERDFVDRPEGARVRVQRARRTMHFWCCQRLGFGLSALRVSFNHTLLASICICVILKPPGGRCPRVDTLWMTWSSD